MSSPILKFLSNRLKDFIIILQQLDRNDIEKCLWTINVHTNRIASHNFIKRFVLEIKLFLVFWVRQLSNLRTLLITLILRCFKKAASILSKNRYKHNNRNGKSGAKLNILLAKENKKKIQLHTSFRARELNFEIKIHKTSQEYSLVKHLLNQIQKLNKAKYVVTSYKFLFVLFFIVLFVPTLFVFVNAVLLNLRATDSNVAVANGIDILKYETETVDSTDTVAEFNSTTITADNFELGENDLRTVGTTNDFIELNHYGDNPPDIANADWYKEGVFATCSEAQFNNGTYLDTQFDIGDNFTKLSGTGLINGNGTYTSQIFDAGASTSWESFGWEPKSPYNKEYPYLNQIETAYTEDNLDMTGNLLLLDLNDPALSTTFQDRSGTGNNADCTDCPTFEINGKIGAAADFDGIRNNMQTPDDGSLDLTTQGTLEIWFNSDNVATNEDLFAGLIHKGGLADFSDDAYGLQFWNDGAVANDGDLVFFTRGSTGVYSGVYSLEATDIQDGVWYHVVGTWDSNAGPNGEMNLYINGVLENNNVVNPLAPAGSVPVQEARPTNSGVVIGAQLIQDINPVSRNYPFDGLIDNVAIYDRVLSPAEIESRYERGARELQFQVRSCDDPNCIGESFIGPDGTGATFYDDTQNITLDLPTLSLTNVPNNRYFQYRATFTTELATTGPEFSCTEIVTTKLNNWRYRRCLDIDYSAGSTQLDEYQIYLDFDTASLISSGQMLADGADIRLATEDGVSLPFYIADGMNTSSTRIWAQVDEIQAASNEPVCLYYGYVPYLNNPIPANLPVSQSDKESVFTYTSQKPIYYVVNPEVENGISEFVSYVDNNNISVSTYNQTLNEYDFDIFPSSSATLAQDTIIETTAPINGAYDGGGSDALVPGSSAGTSFVYRSSRGTNTFSFSSPWCSANVEVRNSQDLLVTGGSFTVTQGTVNNLSTNNNATTGLSNSDTVMIEVTNGCPILVTHDAGGSDGYVMYPATTEWYGVGSNQLEIAAIQDNTSITVYQSDGSTQVYLLDRGDSINDGGLGTEGSAPSQRIVADAPVGVKSLADSDGNESTTFMPVDEMGFKYYIPHDAQYIAIATREGTSTTVDYHTAGDTCGDGTPDGGTQTVSPLTNFPGKIYFGSTTDGVNILRGACIFSDQPIFLYYEEASTDDERNAWNYKQNRQYIFPEPTIALGAVQAVSLNLGESNTWTQRAPVTLTNNSTTDTIDEYQFKVKFDSQAVVFNNAQTDGGDLRVAGALGDGSDNFDYWLETYDEPNQLGDIWIQFDSIAPGGSQTAYVYWNASLGTNTTGSVEEVFTYSSPKPVFYTVDDSWVTQNLEVISFEDSNTISDGINSVTINEKQITPIPLGAFISRSDIFDVTAPLHIGFSADATDSAVPIGYAGTEFVYLVTRNTDVFSFYAPYAPATVEIQQSSGVGYSTLNTVNVPSGSVVTVTQDIADNFAFKLLSNEPILAFKGTDSNQDTQILYPTDLAFEENSGQYELFGVGSNSLLVAAANDNTSVTIYRSDGTSTNVVLGTSNNFVYEESGGGAQGNGLGYRVVADGPIGISSVADADGTEAMTGLSQREFSDTYALAHDTQYISVVTEDPNVTCRIFDENGVEVTTGPGAMDSVPPQTSGALVAPFPNKIFIGGDDTSDGAFFLAGYRMECTEPVFAYYEYHISSTITNETNFLTWPQVRQRAEIEPLVEDPDTADEEGLYYPSGLDSTTTALQPEAFFEKIIDLSSVAGAEDVYWHKVTFDGDDGSLETNANSVIPIQFDVAFGDSSTDCTTASYSSFVTVGALGYIPDEYSDNRCLLVRTFLRTANDAFSPRIESLNVSYYIPTELEGILNNPTVNIQGNFDILSERKRILKLSTAEIITGSEAFLSFDGGTNNAVFGNADFEILDNNTQVIISQFDYPIFPVTPPSDIATNQVGFDETDTISIYFDHKRSTGSTEELDLTFFIDLLNAGQSEVLRFFSISVSGT